MYHIRKWNPPVNMLVLGTPMGCGSDVQQDIFLRLLTAPRTGGQGHVKVIGHLHGTSCHDISLPIH